MAINQLEPWQFKGLMPRGEEAFRLQLIADKERYRLDAIFWKGVAIAAMILGSIGIAVASHWA